MNRVAYRGRGETTFFKDVTVLAEREVALQVSIPGTSPLEHWVPKSMIHDDSEVFDGFENAGPGKLVVSLWWAEQAKLA